MLTDSLLSPSRTIGPYAVDEFIEEAARFHGYAAPGLVLGGFMVDAAMKALPSGILYDAISETAWCLPDAVQMLTPCSIGNGWLRIENLGLYAVALYDKLTGKGVRVRLDLDKVDPDSEIRTWFLKLKPKKQQDSVLLRSQIVEAGAGICSMSPILVKPDRLFKRSKGKVTPCPLCGEAYPARFGAICRSCQGDSPYADRPSAEARLDGPDEPALRSVPVEKAVGGQVLHDMTRVDPGVSKGVAFRHGQRISGGDVCRLQRMGRSHVFLADQDPGNGWVHENEAATAFGKLMAGPGVKLLGEPREGKAKLVADKNGLFTVDRERLKQFNHVPGVMCATRQSFALVQRGAEVAGTRAIPLYLARKNFEAALRVLDEEPLCSVRPLRSARIGVLVTGTEVFKGLVEDRFAAVVSAKAAQFDCRVVQAVKVPDEVEAISGAVRELARKECDLIVTTAGLSVDPDDVTRKGLLEAGVTDVLYGMPTLPGAMTLLGRLGAIQILGIPACALYHKTTSLDLLLPRLLAGVPVTRSDLAEFGEGGLCHECKTCTFPKCTFGR